MTTNSASNNRTPSTTWGWRKVRISPAPQAGSDRGPKGRHPRSLPGRNPREPLTVTVTYRGGSECWWELRARGAVIRRPGHLCLQDVLWELAR